MSKFDEIRKNLNKMSSPLDVRHQKVLKEVEKYEKILEIGPGEGVQALRLVLLGKEIDLLDINGHALDDFFDYCARALEVKRIPYLYEYESPKQWSHIKDNEYDCVFAMEVIEHIKDWEEAVCQMVRIARKKVVITTPVNHSYDDPSHLHYFKEEDLAWIGGKIEKIITKEKDKTTGSRCFFIEKDCEV